MQRQLPLVAQRLSETLERLQRPQAAAETYASAETWWQGLQRQYHGEGVEFQAPPPPAQARLPRSLFDSVADNLIRNALAKRAVDGPTRVQASLEQRAHLALRVRDTGSAVPAELAKDLLRAPVASREGLGIGLYQAARQADAAGYALVLESNRNGNVCFALTGPAG